MLEHLMEAARAEGVLRLSLETGGQPTFIAARALYKNAGPEACPPFEGYWDDPNSVFMTHQLAEQAGNVIARVSAEILPQGQQHIAGPV